MNLKEKFENYTQPVDEASWESIVQDPALVKYNRGQRIRRICKFGIPTVVVATLLTTAILLGTRPDTVTETPVVPQTTIPAPVTATPTEATTTTVVTPAQESTPVAAAPAPTTKSAPAKVTSTPTAPAVPTPRTIPAPTVATTTPTVVTPPTSTVSTTPTVATPAQKVTTVATPTPSVTEVVTEEPKNATSETPEEPVSQYDFYIPNAFTPNGDGINDLLYFKANFEPKTFEVAIYNRRGEQVFHSRNMEIGWDGSFQGRELPGEVYSYIIKYTDPDNKVLNRRGQVIIIR